MQLKPIKGKKGVFDQLITIGVGIAGFSIAIVVVLLILAQTAANSTVAADNNASAAVVSMQASTQDLVGWVPLVIIGLIGALLLSLVALFAASRAGR